MTQILIQIPLKSMELFLHFSKNINLWYFSEGPQIHRKLSAVQTSVNVSQSCIQVNADTVIFKDSCNDQVCAHFEKTPFSSKVQNSSVPLNILSSVQPEVFLARAAYHYKSYKMK